MLLCRSSSTTSRHFGILGHHLARIISRTFIQLSGVTLCAWTAASSLLLIHQDGGKRNEAAVLEFLSEPGNDILDLLFQRSCLRMFSPLTTKWMNLMHVSNSNGISGTAVCWHSSRRGLSRRYPTRQLPRWDLTYFVRTEQLIQASAGAGGGVCVMINSLWAMDIAILASHCYPVLELLTVKIRPFYLPREFTSFVVSVVYIPPPGR